MYGGCICADCGNRVPFLLSQKHRHRSPNIGPLWSFIGSLESGPLDDSSLEEIDAMVLEWFGDNEDLKLLKTSLQREFQWFKEDAKEYGKPAQPVRQTKQQAAAKPKPATKQGKNEEEEYSSILVRETSDQYNSDNNDAVPPSKKRKAHASGGSPSS